MQELSKYNEKLIKEHLQRCAALPSQPGENRLKTIKAKLSTVARLAGKPLDRLTEKDLQELNLTMREREMKSSQDYRKTLKRFLKLKDKKKFIELIDSDYLKAPRGNGHKALVDPDNFWSEEENNRYIQESKAHSKRQGCWAALWIATGCRPHELLALKKESIELEEKTGTLLVRVNSKKTGKRSIVFQGNEALGIWKLCKPYLDQLSPSNLLFPYTYNAIKKTHVRICKKLRIKKPFIFYNARKAALTRFYNTYGMAKAASMAGHVPGSSAMKHYVAMSETQLKEQTLPKIEIHQCPNPACGFANEPYYSHCQKCGSPLDKAKFAAIFERNMNELIENRLALFKSEMENKLLKMQRR